jgi:HEAT repeat protein
MSAHMTRIIIALILVCLGYVAFSRYRVARDDVAAPAPHDVFHRALPAPQLGKDGDVAVDHMRDAAIRDAISTYGDESARNQKLNVLAQEEDERLFDVLLDIMENPKESERMRSWAAQHVGMQWERMHDSDSGADVMAQLDRMAAGRTESALPEREAIYALAQSTDPAARAMVRREVDKMFATGDRKRLDLAMRLSRELGWKAYLPRIKPFMQDADWFLSRAATLAVEELEGRSL